jgi:hypothetical protein
MNELLREIEEDLRREKFDRLWGNIGKIMIGVSALVILTTIIVVAYQNHKETRAMEQTGQFISGLDHASHKDYKGAIVAFTQISDDTSSSYYGLAMLRKAQAQADAGDKAGAAETYKALASADNTFSTLAVMQGGNMNISPDKKSPFYYTLAEWQGWQLVNAGKKDEAVTKFIVLRDDTEAPFSMRQRMQDVVQQLAPGSMMKDNRMKDEQQ